MLYRAIYVQCIFPAYIKNVKVNEGLHVPPESHTQCSLKRHMCAAQENISSAQSCQLQIEKAKKWKTVPE